MIIFVNKKELTLKILDDPTAEIRQSEVIIQGKRRDRHTAKGAWCEDIDEAKAALRKAISDTSIEISQQITALVNAQENLATIEHEQLEKITILIRKNNNSIFN